MSSTHTSKTPHIVKSKYLPIQIPENISVGQYLYEEYSEIGHEHPEKVALVGFVFVFCFTNLKMVSRLNPIQDGHLNTDN